MLEELLPAMALEKLRRGQYSPLLEKHWPSNRRALATERDAAALCRCLPLLVGREDGVVECAGGARVIVHLLDPQRL